MTTSTALALDLFVNSNNPALEPLRNGSVKIRGVELNQLKMLNVIIPFRRMCRHEKFDISELAVVAYFVGRRYKLPYRALPIFPALQYDYGAGIIVNKNIVKTAKDLEGKKVGMRAYTVTVTPWQCGYLAAQGVDTKKITFVSNDEEHNNAFHADAPSNVVYHKGADLVAMVASGELAAACGIPAGDNPDLVPLNPNAKAEGIERFKKDHVYRLIHLMTIHESVLESNPWVLRATFDAFKAAKEMYLAEKGPIQPWEDPLPMGLDDAYASLDELQQLCVDIDILKSKQDIEELFPGHLN
jgi:4,5-dihydroxyphthalate decarboxylase